MVEQSVDLPTYEELNVQELNLSAPVLKAGALYLGQYCDQVGKEFMLCHREEKDPRKCLEEGKAVTQCAFDFFHKVRGTCMESFTSYAKCIDHAGKTMDFNRCRETQKMFDDCIKANMNIERPPLGYFSKVRLHETSRPEPTPPYVNHQFPEAVQQPPSSATMRDTELPPPVKKFGKMENPLMW